MNKLYFVVAVCLCSFHLALGQSCPSTFLSTLNSFPNTYYPAGQSNVAAGSRSIVLSGVPTGFGSTPISTGDVLLIIQMQGAQIRSINNGAYGANGGAGNGYLVNTSLLVGYMEYVVASNSVPLTGGTLSLGSGTVHAYQSSAFGSNGQYSYQVLRVPLYNNLQLTGAITAPAWNGAVGGVVMMYVDNNLNFNGQSVSASGAGFRGGGGRVLSGASGLSSADYMTTIGYNANGSKGEGIAGTPAYILSSGSVIYTNYEGYPGGSYARGGPGNAGGGGTDGNPSSNDQNSGGGGGSNGGAGGIGGNTWSSNIASGGKPGANFAQVAASRLIMGGGGGAGTTNNGTGTPGNGAASSGAAGGGIVMIIVGGSISGSGTISVDGSDGNSTVQNDGSGGGGAGGSIMVFANGGGQSGITASAIGGGGGSNQSGGGASHGPGGGGGGGVIYSNQAFASASITGGAAGFTSGGTSNYGAASGSSGTLVSNMSVSAFANPNVSCVILATSYIDLSASYKDGNVHLTWEATSESNTDKYIIERSTDGSSFESIGTALPQTPASAVDTYKFDDNENLVNVGTVYYRIVEVKTSGATAYSRIVPVQTSSSSQQTVFTAFPNPTMGAVTVRFYSAAPKTMNLQLYNLQGAILWQQEYSANEGVNTLSIGKFGTLPEGLYILSWKDGQTGGQVKVIVRR